MWGFAVIKPLFFHPKNCFNKHCNQSEKVPITNAQQREIKYAYIELTTLGLCSIESGWRSVHSKPKSNQDTMMFYLIKINQNVTIINQQQLKLTSGEICIHSLHQLPWRANLDFWKLKLLTANTASNQLTMGARRLLERISQKER